ncbi:D-ribose pyranase [Corynebacterium poyangense]|uniref:D-ribose pyranase n=1 Tax=Corynebacterium poyangense TaxID=2684405 RepID=A0A7H0SRK4_9CORY|nr:D-ribose pyranase [Corynebacterium poyangense]MBZ8176611.1 D-ribose pyranase [Corynebacterium poyangense]QNQ91179.1 D-ribose pyranase [Corynebacterium poyangense]
MRKQGILNSQLAGLIARLGHTDTVVVADCGLPIPSHVPVVDLALVFGVPRFHEVWQALIGELEIEAITIAQETPATLRELIMLDATPVQEVSHEELKKRSSNASFVVRTGETTPYANAIIHCGVPF